MKTKLTEAPLAYWEEKSYMMIIPKEVDEEILKRGMDYLNASKEISIKETNYDVKGFIEVKLTYEKEEYEVGFYLGDISVPDYYLTRNFLFTEDEKREILASKKAVTIFMKFLKNAKKSFYLQLKLATTFVPNYIGILDESAEKMMPKKWVELAVQSKVLPSAKDLFTVQAVQGKYQSVWLHTHGLCRCHLTELEILDSDQEHFGQHYNLLSTYAMYLIDKENENPESSAYIGRLINGYPVVVTSIPWTKGILEYKKLRLGGQKDRIGGHNSKTNIVFLYKSEEDEQKGVLSKVSLYDELWGENPLFFFSDEETDRMRELARERFHYVKEYFEGNSVLLKIGLPLEEKGKFEHIWFELLEFKGNKFKAKLTQEPYGVPDIHTGYEAWYTLNDVTDWIIYTENFAVSPSNVYLLETDSE